MMTQLDEIENDKAFNMNFVEFLEALVRVAEKLTIPNLFDVSVFNHLSLHFNRMLSFSKKKYSLRHKKCGKKGVCLRSLKA